MLIKIICYYFIRIFPKNSALWVTFFLYVGEQENNKIIKFGNMDYLELNAHKMWLCEYFDFNEFKCALPSMVGPLFY